MLSLSSRIYMDAQDACGLKKGDWVKVTGKVEEGNPIWNLWNSKNMDCTVGRVGEIKDILPTSIEVNFGDCLFCYPYFVLEIVEKPAHEFKPFERVLVRDGKHLTWYPDIFLWKDEAIPATCYKCCRSSFAYCIPYEGNEHLLGTTDSPEE